MSKDHLLKRKMLVLDIETLGVSQSAQVYEVGIIKSWGWPSASPLEERSWFLHGNDQKHRSVDPSTIGWMKSKGLMARLEQARDTGTSVRHFYRELEPYLGDKPAIWTWGPQFDLSILESLFLDKNLSVPWRYDTPRDLRTLDSLYTLMSGVGKRDTDNIPHDALGDCRLQLARLRKAFAFLQGS